MNDRRPTVLCVDDNDQVGEALRLRLARTPRVAWLGHLPSAEGLLAEVAARAPDLVLLDIDMPGPDPFEALAGIARAHPGTRVIVFSGHVRLEYVERALEAGAWAYVSKNDDDACLIEAIDRVLLGEVYLSPEAHSAFGRAS